MSDEPEQFKAVNRMAAQAARSPYREALDWISTPRRGTSRCCRGHTPVPQSLISRRRP